MHIKKHKLLKELWSYDKFMLGEIELINFPKLHQSTVAKEVLSYGEYLQKIRSIPVIKLNSFTWKKFSDVHLFVHNCSGKSFSWHRDPVNVVLYVLHGQKKVFTKNKVSVLFPGDFIKIPKNKLHYVVSKKNTIALSIGLTNGQFNLLKDHRDL
jgi:mannose-6-phosphate isomerase-like protein (cupin superfamily)